MDVVSEKGNHLGLVELTMDVLDHLSDAQVSSQAMVVVGAKDIQSDVMIIGDIEQSLVGKEVTILWSDQGSGYVMAGMVVVESGLTYRHVR